MFALAMRALLSLHLITKNKGPSSAGETHEIGGNRHRRSIHYRRFHQNSVTLFQVVSTIPLSTLLLFLCLNITFIFLLSRDQLLVFTHLKIGMLWPRKKVSAMSIKSSDKGKRQRASPLLVVSMMICNSAYPPLRWWYQREANSSLDYIHVTV